MKIRGRFAPTPSGDPHPGTIQTALLAWLSARAQGGRFILRIEDVDGARVVPGAAERMIETLDWLGLDWDEGPGVDGPHGPYVQSRRTGFYQEMLDRLINRGLAYPCACSRSFLAQLNLPRDPEDGALIYPGICRAPDPERFRELELRGRPPAWRFRVEPETAAFHDLIQGPVSQEVSRGAGDFVLKRGDGYFAYQLAVTADDIAMGVTEVVRGTDLLFNTPRQLLLLRALGGKAPVYAHMPLLLGPDGEKLAKRHQAPSIWKLKQQGASPGGITGWIASGLGLCEPGARLKPAELLKSWDIRRIPARPRVADMGELLRACQT
ncbi:MAG: Glutamate--tRNA ligase 1 [Myxococcota bacterium]|nr:Glutamate--tRNA ligase 1 [Myxococcota bacterium]